MFSLESLDLLLAISEAELIEELLVGLLAAPALTVFFEKMPRATSDGRSAVGTTTDTSGSAGTLTTARRYRFAPRPDSRGAVRSRLAISRRRALDTPWQPRDGAGRAARGLVGTA